MCDYERMLAGVTSPTAVGLLKVTLEYLLELKPKILRVRSG